MLIHEALRIQKGDVISLVGGGGKTTLMFRLADELTAAGLRVASTMTTKIFVGQMARAPASLLLEDDETVLFGALPFALEQHRHVLIGGRIGAEREKLEGVPPHIIDRIVGERLADIVIVEADGSRRLPFKAPAEHEPVLPKSTTVLAPLVGLDVLGQPLDADHAHRAPLIAALAGVEQGVLVTPEIVARVLAHRSGGMKGVPAGARCVPFLNKADDDERLDGGREIARLLLASTWVDEVLIGATEAIAPVREAWGLVAAVVLAAGQAKRFGALKQILPWRGTPLVAHVARQALACPDVHNVVVTTGAEGRAVLAASEAVLWTNEAALQPVEQHAVAPHLIAINVADWADGQSRSVRAGLRAAQESAGGAITGVLFLLADQPGVSPELLSALIQRHRETLAPVVAPRYGEQRGNPVLFDRRTFAEFDLLTGDEGARAIIRRHEDAIAWVDWPTAEILKDIDTPDDYVAAQPGDWSAP